VPALQETELSNFRAFCFAATAAGALDTRAALTDRQDRALTALAAGPVYSATASHHGKRTDGFARRHKFVRLVEDTVTTSSSLLSAIGVQLLAI
jgi:hypothetical protein